MNRHRRVRGLIPAAVLLGAIPAVAATPPTPEPPAAYVTPGRTYDPAEPMNPPTGGGAQYHVSLSGSDSNAGTAALPFRTVQRGLDALSGGGDTLLIHGGLYRERPSMSGSSAPAGNPFVIRPFGDGEVVIDASAAIPAWSDQGGGIHRAVPGFVVGAVVVDNQPLYRETSLSRLQAAPTVAGVPSEARYFYEAGTGALYVRLAQPPASRDVGVIRDSKDDHGLYLWDSDNVVIYGLTVRFAGGYGINVYGGNNVRVERCKVVFNHWTGLSALKIDGASAATNTRFIKNYVYHNFMSNWPRGDGDWVWGGWGTGMSFQGAPSSLMEGNISEKNGGEGILSYSGDGGNTFRNNVSADNWSVNFYYDNHPDGLIEGNLAVCHRPQLSDTYGNGWAAGTEGEYRGVRTTRAIAIMTADEDYQDGAKLNNVLIRNNVLLNCRRGLEHYAVNSLAGSSGLKNVKVVNNTIRIPTDRFLPYDDDIGGISIPYNSGNNAGSIYQNNIVYGGDADSWHMRMVDGGAISENFRGLTIDHNLFDTAVNDRPFLWGGNWGARYSHAQWLALAGLAHGAGDLTSSPAFANGSSDRSTDKRLAAGSAGLDAGAVSAHAPVDFNGVSRPQGPAPDMGAFEGAGSSDRTPPGRPVRFRKR